MADAGRIVIIPKGEYKSNITYERLDAVEYNNNGYIALKTVTGITPTNDGTNWALYVKGGAEVDSELSDTSTNAVQNKIVTAEISALKKENINQSTEMLDIKMLGWSVPRECPIQNEVSGNQFVQKVGRIDLGEVEWSYYSERGYEGLRGKNPGNLKAVSNNGHVANIYTSVYEASTADNAYNHTKDKIISVNTSGYISIYDSSYTDADTFKKAMQGQFLYYELATPITKTIDGNEIDQRHSMNLTNQQNNGYLQKNLVDYKSLFNELSNNVTGTTHTYSDGVLKISRVKDISSGVYVYSKQITPLQSKELVVSFDAKSSVSTMNLRVYICNGEPKNTENLTTDYKRYCLYVKAGNAENAFIIYGNDVAGDVWIKNLMITEKYVEDTTYVDCIKSNKELDTYKADKSETTVNLLNPALQTETQNGVTCTNNGDGTYTLDGVATANTYFTISTNIALSRGKYNILCESNSDAFMAYITKEHDFDFLRYVGVCDITDETEYRYVLHVPLGKKVNFVTVHPMLTTNLAATLDDFVPYTGDAGSLNGDVASLLKRIQALESQFASETSELCSDAIDDLASVVSTQDEAIDELATIVTESEEK